MRHIKILLLAFFTLISFISRATHIRAGEIIAKRVSGNIYQFTFIGYRDVEGVAFGNGTFDFGDGTKFGGATGDTIPWGNIEDLGNGVEKWQFTLVHEYAAGANYLVSYQEDFRNANIQNMSGSVSTSFYVETLVVIDALIVNSTPFFTVPPIDQGVVGAIFEHNPGAFDPDGDSLSYYFTTPKRASGLEVNGYRSLIDPSFYDNFASGNSTKDGPPTLTIDSVTGTLVWDAPGGASIPDMENREFNVAFVVEEWRRINGELIRLGYVTRDMQIIIWNYENEPPELEIPEDTCVVAGSTIIGLATGTDPDGDPVKVEAFGGPFELNPAATYTPNPADFVGPPSVLTFEWETSCGLVRAEPYEVQFKATDRPDIPGILNAPGQVNFETWRITVVGPAPEGLVAETITGRRIQLNWDNYSCTNADSIQVWRRVGEFAIDATCNPGIPENSGYELIETLDSEETSFLDSNNGDGLDPGSKYCYRLVATFPAPGGGLSIASEEACDSLVVDVPVITNVDVVSTDEVTGEVRVRWTPPYEINAAQFPPTYSYELLRAEGSGPGGPFTSVTTTTDTTFLDTDLNTMDLSYSYCVIVFDGNGIRVDTSQQASTVRLLPVPQVGAIRLNWSANVPWSNSVQDFPYHYIYRDNVDNGDLSAIQLIDSVEVTADGLTYTDDGSHNGVELEEETEYCYFVTTQGSYDNAILPEPLINNSQIICAQPNDTIPPCPPVSIIFDSNFDCEDQVSCGASVQLRNVLRWDYDNQVECDDDINFFRVYVSTTGEEDSFSLLAQTSNTEYFHEGLSSLAFCYYVTSVDRSGNESLISEIVCNNNCPQYLLPNVFTPNGDGRNDTFRPLQANGQCPRFVESVVFKVFNRTGAEIFNYDSTEPENTILINWDGKSKAGLEMPAGVYFYSAEVKFIDLNPDESIQVINGWVQIIR